MDVVWFESRQGVGNTKRTRGEMNAYRKCVIFVVAALFTILLLHGRTLQPFFNRLGNATNVIYTKADVNKIKTHDNRHPANVNKDSKDSERDAKDVKSRNATTASTSGASKDNALSVPSVQKKKTNSVRPPPFKLPPDLKFFASHRPVTARNSSSSSSSSSPSFSSSSSSSSSSSRLFDMHPPEGNHKTILFYNPPFWETTNVTFSDCDVTSCRLTLNKTALATADAVVFYMCVRDHSRLPYEPPPGQVWVAFGLESPPHCFSYRNPYKRPFNLTMTYRTDADLFYPYGLLQQRAGQPGYKDYAGIVSRKKKAVAWFVSNCNDKAKRLNYVNQLSKYIQVDIYGHCGPLKCPRGGPRDCTHMLNEEYYFYLAPENSLCLDYMTEKVWKVYDGVDVIPVVRGRVDYARYLPPGTFINTADFGSPRQLAEHLQALIKDKEAFTTMLKTKDAFPLFSYQGIARPLCQLCKKLHEPHVNQVYRDLEKWATQGVCVQATDI